DRKASWVALSIGRSSLSANCGEAQENFRFLAYVVKQFGAGVLAKIVRNGEGAVSAGTFGMHHAFGDTLAVEVRHFLVENEILQQQRTSRTHAHRIFMMIVGNSRGCSEFFFFAHTFCFCL